MYHDEMIVRNHLDFINFDIGIIVMKKNILIVLKTHTELRVKCDYHSYSRSTNTGKNR